MAHEVRVPRPVADILSALAAAGHEAALVGGCVRDLIAGTAPGDWDVATSATPETVTALFPESTWANEFGTVTVRVPMAEGEPMAVEVTTYRSEGDYRDARHPTEVRWGTSLTDDLQRRDFTINAMAWVPDDLASGRGHLVDPFGGEADLRARLLRAVGDPEARLTDDALRLLRAVRFSATLGMAMDPATEAAVAKLAPTAALLSGERVRDEILRILAWDGAPSAALSLMERLDLLVVVLPELAALRGVEQGKALGGDALDHSFRTADVLPSSDPLLRFTGLVHDVGKAPTASGGHFIGHESVGADLVGVRMRALAFSNANIERVTHLIRHHLIAYTSEWSDAAVRRFLLRIGDGAPLTDLLALRRADTAASAGSGVRDVGADELEGRIRALEGAAVLSLSGLAVNGEDLMRELGLAPGPEVGRLLDGLLQAVLDDPSRNDRETLLRLAGEAAATTAGGGAPAHHGSGRKSAGS